MLFKLSVKLKASPAHSPASNKVAERMNRVLLTKVTALSVNGLMSEVFEEIPRIMSLIYLMKRQQGHWKWRLFTRDYLVNSLVVLKSDCFDTRHMYTCIKQDKGNSWNIIPRWAYILDIPMDYFAFLSHATGGLLAWDTSCSMIKKPLGRKEFTKLVVRRGTKISYSMYRTSHFNNAWWKSRALKKINI